MEITKTNGQHHTLNEWLHHKNRCNISKYGRNLGVQCTCGLDDALMSTYTSGAATMKTVEFSQLEPQYVTPTPDGFQTVDTIEAAQGVMFLCPKCYSIDPESAHYILCWSPSVPRNILPGPGRWAIEGTNFSDITLKAPSSSIAISHGCMWHGFVQNGKALF